MADKNIGRKQIGYRMDLDLAKHVQHTALDRNISAGELVTEAVIALIGKPGQPRRRKSSKRPGTPAVAAAA